MAERDAAADALAGRWLLSCPSRYQTMAAAGCAEVSRKWERNAKTTILESYNDQSAGLGLFPSPASACQAPAR